MVWLTKSEIRKLMFVCENRQNDANTIFENATGEYTEFERTCACCEAEYMKGLRMKLNRILESDAKRVEIKRG